MATKISNPEIRAKILSLLGDSEIVSIMQEVTRESKNALLISQATRIPLSTVYRKLSDLKEAGLVFRERLEVSPEGKKLEYYRCAVSEIRVEVIDGRLELQMNTASPMADRIWAQLFTGLSEPSNSQGT